LNIGRHTTIERHPTMIAAWLNGPDWLRAAVVLMLCGSLFFSDVHTAVDLNEAQLYPGALLLLYRPRDKRLPWLVAGAAIALAIVGYLMAPSADIWDGVTNRAFSILMILVTAYGLGRLAQNEQRLLLAAMVDPLTGVLNRRRFTELSKIEEGRSRRHGLPFAVLMIDIDHFKRINDGFGHPVGDQAIRALAETCARSLRPHDLLARFGGEEFVLTLPQTDLEGAAVVAERVRQAVEQLALPSEAGTVRFTISIGIATYRSGRLLEEIIESADQALYRAKEAGRNRVELAIPGQWRPHGALG
jgi:diguanylate cyclase (GGDEF)-like protein